MQLEKLYNLAIIIACITFIESVAGLVVEIEPFAFHVPILEFLQVPSYFLGSFMYLSHERG